MNNDERCDCSNIDQNVVASAILNNGILPLVFPVLDKEPKAEEMRAILKNRYYASVKQNIVMDIEGKRVKSALSEEGFVFIMLKGWEMRNLYSDFTHRSMNDIDILVKNYDYKRICKAMQRIGYSSVGESYWMHDSFVKGSVTIEIHKRLTDDYGDIRLWEDTIWHSTTIENNVLNMSKEDFYIFHVVHMYTDFISGSFGLRRVVDTWLLLSAFKDMNWEYVRDWLTRFNMVAFDSRIQHLAMCCMGKCTFDHNSEVLFEFAFDVGICGNGRSNRVSRVVRYSKGSIASGKINSIKASVFPPISRMKAQYPILNRHIYLLPWCWLRRSVRHLLHFSKYKLQANYADICESEYQNMSDVFQAGGIDCNRIK